MSEVCQHKFQVGDVVRCIKGNDYFSKGATGTILSFLTDGSCYVRWENGTFRDGSGGRWYAMPSEIEVIERTKDQLNMKQVLEGPTMNSESADHSHYKTDGVVSRDKQVGGNHYKEHAIQPWDIIIEYGLDYFEGNALKYLLRRKNNRFEDLSKAIHYLEQASHMVKQKAASATYATEKKS